MSVAHSKAKVSTESTQITSVWKNRNFLILFLTGIVISFGSKVYELALPLILFEMTHSSVTMGTMRAIEFLPNLLLAMVIGVFVDRANKKKWIQTSVVIQMLLLLSIYLLIEWGYAQIYHFYLTGFTLMALYYAYGNARISIVKQVIPTTMLTSANAKFTFVDTLVSIMGPAISGFILLLSDLHDGLLITAITFLIAIGTTSFLETIELPKPKKNTSFNEDLKEGWRALRANRPLWLITLLVIFLNSTAGMFDAMVIFYAKDTLQLSNATLGLALSAAGLGGLVGSSLVTYARQRFQTGHLMGITIMCIAIAYIIMFLSTNVWMMCIALFLEGLFGTIQSICIWTFRQETTPSELIGRISGITGSIFKLGMVFTIFGAGWISELFGTGYVFIGAAIMNICIFLVYRRMSLWHLK